MRSKIIIGFMVILLGISVVITSCSSNGASVHRYDYEITVLEKDGWVTYHTDDYMVGSGVIWFSVDGVRYTFYHTPMKVTRHEVG